MEEAYTDLLALRIVVSIVGMVGNTMMIASILQMPRLKSFEVFLLGLAVANVEEMVSVAVYDVLLQRFSSGMSVWMCRGLKFLSVFGESASILLTVLISVYRYQKLRDVHSRVSLPIRMDSMGSACILAVVCAAVALLFAFPTLLVNLDWTLSNSSSPVCAVDFFQCSQTRCPTRNRVYKYSFLLVCNLLPLLVVTASGVLIVRVLLAQQRAARARLSPGVTPHQRHRKSGFQRSTLAVLAAMTLFQVSWSVYLVLHLACNPYSFPSWSELEFFITTFYSAVSPYVYGIGSSLFIPPALRDFCHRCTAHRAHNTNSK